MEEKLGPIKRMKGEKMFEIYCVDMVVCTQGWALAKVNYEDFMWAF